MEVSKSRYVCSADVDLLMESARISGGLKHQAMRRREGRNSREIRNHRINGEWSFYLAGKVAQLKLPEAASDFVPIQQIELGPLEMKVLDQARTLRELAAAAPPVEPVTV